MLPGLQSQLCLSVRMIYVAIIYTKHAKEMLVHRGIKKQLADECAKSPDITLPAENNNKIYLKDFGVNYLKISCIRRRKR